MTFCWPGDFFLFICLSGSCGENVRFLITDWLLLMPLGLMEFSLCLLLLVRFVLSIGCWLDCCCKGSESRSKDSLPVQTTVSDSDLVCCLIIADGSCLVVVAVLLGVSRWAVISLGGVSVVFEFLPILFSDEIEEVEEEDNCDSFELELLRSSDEDELEPEDTTG